MSGDPSRQADGDDQSARTTDGAEHPGAGEGAGEPPGTEVAELVERLSVDERMDRITRLRLLRRLARVLRARSRRAGTDGTTGGRGLADILGQVGPHIPVRGLEVLSAHYGGLTGEQLADALTRTAARATATVGAAGGALAAVEFVAPPLLLTVPAQLMAESLVVASIEVKLIAELHEVYGVRISGGLAVRGSVFLGAWARQRGVDPLQPGSVPIALGVATRAAMRKRMLRTLGRHLTTLGPFLAGAVAGGLLNRAATIRLAKAVRKDLRRAGGAAGHGGAQPGIGPGEGRPALPE